MYNEEYKQNYLNMMESINVNANVTINLLFRRIESYEEKLGKDLYDFTSSEILDYYKSLCTPSLESLMVMNSQYSKYTAHALSDSLVSDCQNHYQEITYDMLSKCINYGLAEAKIISREDLIFMLEQTDANISDKFLCLAIFEGIGGASSKEFYDLRCDAFNYDEHIVELNTGRRLAVSERLIKYAIKSSETYDYYYLKGEKESQMHYNIHDDRIVKCFANADPYAALLNYRRAIYFRLARLSEYINSPAIGIASLKESGKLNAIKEMVNAQGISYAKAIQSDEIVYRYGVTPSISRYMIKYGLKEE